MNALIIEDEVLLAKELEATLTEVDETIKVIDVLPSLKTARKWFMQNAEPDIIFMDVQLSDGISFTLFEEFKLNCPVIFTTAYDQYAVKAFKVNGVDYLLKPVNKDDIHKALQKCRINIENKLQQADGRKDLLNSIQQQRDGKPVFKEKFIASFRNQWLPVDTKDIACFYKDALHYAFTFSGEKYILSYDSMEDIEALLNPYNFYRANRQVIININAIQGVKSHNNAKLTVTLKLPVKLEIDISRDKAPQFRKWVDR